MIKEIEIVDPIPPDLMPEPYEGLLPEFAMFKHKGGGHDQKTHGNWATGYTEAERAGIEAMRDKGPTTEQMLAYVRSEGEKVPLTREQARILILNDEDLYETYTAFIFNRLATQFPDEDNISPKVDIAVDEDTYLDEFIDIQDVTNEYATEMADESLNDEEMAQLFDEVYGVSVTTPEGVELQTKVTFALKSGDKILVRGHVQADGEHVGNFRREFRPEGDTFSAQHELFRIDDSQYRGFGLGKEFLRQSEDWYIARGITQIKTLTGWDGFYTWSKAGFDFVPAITKGAIGLIVNRVENAVLDKTLTLNETDIWNGLLERSTEGLDIRTIGSSQRRYEFNAVKNIRDEDFPLPAEFARAPKAKDILRDLTISMVKYLTPEGRSLADTPIDRDGDGMVFDGTPRERPAKPSELPVAAAKWSKRDTKLQAISNAYYKYGKDDFINENEGSDQDNPELDRAIDKILGKSDFMKRLASFSYSVVKHQAGTHDQSSHGNWADGLGYRSKNLDASGISQADITKAYQEAGGSERKIDNEIDALEFYVGTGFSDINRNLRGQGLDPRTEDFEWEMETVVQTIYGNEEFFREYQDWQQQNDGSIEEFAEANMDTITEYLEEVGDDRLLNAQEYTKPLRELIERMPATLGNTTVYRVFSENVINELEVGDVITDKGFLSTTAIDLTNPKEKAARGHLSDLSDTEDVVGVILPKRGGDGKALYVNSFFEAAGANRMPINNREKEVLLPPSTSLRLIRIERASSDKPDSPQEDIYIFEREN